MLIKLLITMLSAFFSEALSAVKGQLLLKGHAVVTEVKPKSTTTEILVKEGFKYRVIIQRIDANPPPSATQLSVI